MCIILTLSHNLFLAISCLYFSHTPSLTILSLSFFPYQDDTFRSIELYQEDWPISLLISKSNSWVPFRSKSGPRLYHGGLDITKEWGRIYMKPNVHFGIDRSGFRLWDFLAVWSWSSYLPLCFTWSHFPMKISIGPITQICCLKIVMDIKFLSWSLAYSKCSINYSNGLWQKLCPPIVCSLEWIMQNISQNSIY